MIRLRLARSVARAAALALALAATSAGAAAPMVDRSRPPLPTEVQPYEVREPERFTLSNGLEVLLVERHQVPLIDAVLVVRAGAEDDPKGLYGLASWTGAMLDEGAGDKDALAFADAVEYLGATLQVGVDFETTDLSLHVPSARFSEALSLLADAALRPRFDQKEWQRNKARRATAFLQARDDPWTLSSYARAKALFDGHRYGVPVDGRPQALERAQAADLKAFHRAHYRPDNALLVVTGDVTKETLVPLLEERFSSWKAEGPLPKSAPAAELPLPKGKEIVLVDKPGAAQSVVFVLARAPAGLEPLDGPNNVMNTLLGGSFTSRLNQNLREEKQYSYGARSMFDLRDQANVFAAYAAVATPVTAPAVSEVLKELSRIKSYVEDTEAERAKGYLALSFPSDLATGASIASFWAWAAAEGVAPERVKSYQERVLAVNERSLLEAALRDIDTQNLRVVVVGDRAKIEAELKALEVGPVRVWRAADLL